MTSAGLRLLGSVLLSFGVVFAVLSACALLKDPLRDLVVRYHDRMDDDLRFVQSKYTGRQAVIAQAGGSTALLVFSLVFGHASWLSLLPMIWLVPRGLLGRERILRVVEIDSQVDTWLVLLANALRASPALGDAMASSARLVPQPLSTELQLALREYQLGAPLDVALRTMVNRLKSRTVNVAIGALRIARNTGGNLPETLETSAAALREIARLEGVVRTKTAEGKAQSTVVAAMPFPLVGLLNYMNPKLLEPLFGTAYGYAILSGAFVLWLVALLWARKIFDVDI
jgi:tight adherence protein B